MPFPGLDPGSAAMAYACAANPAACQPSLKPGQCFVGCTALDLTVGYAAEAAVEKAVSMGADAMGKAACKVLFGGYFYLETGMVLMKCYRICYECGGKECPKELSCPLDPGCPRLPPIQTGR